MRASTLKRGRIWSGKRFISSESEKDKFQYLADAISEHHQGIVLSLYTPTKFF